jgi:hypothetical protein
MLVQCRKTGRWYNPDIEFRKVMSSPEVVDKELERAYTV